MRIKIISILIAILYFSASAQAQTIREKIVQQSKDPKTKENAAKADVYIVSKKAVSDSIHVKRNENKCVKRKARKSGELKE